MISLIRMLAVLVAGPGLAPLALAQTAGPVTFNAARDTAVGPGVSTARVDAMVSVVLGDAAPWGSGLVTVPLDSSAAEHDTTSDGVATIIANRTTIPRTLIATVLPAEIRR